MAARHVDVVERLFGLSNRCAAGDADALSELVGAYHADARVASHQPDMPDGDLAQAAIRAYFERVATSYARWEAVLDYAQDFDDRVLALGVLRSVGHDGREREQAGGWIFTFRDDKVSSVRSYPSYGDALRAATSREPLPSG